MFARSLSFALALATALLACLGGGCKKSEPAQTPQNQAVKAQPTPAQFAPAGDTSARLHWLGKKRLAADTNAAYLKTIWDLPESVRLEAQTLDKFALAPWRSALTNYPQPITNYQAVVAANPSASLLRPLVADLLEQESYLEIRQPTNQPPELALAIRLDQSRAGLWQTNLAAVLESTYG